MQDLWTALKFSSAFAVFFEFATPVFACDAEPLVKSISTSFERAALSGSPKAFSNAVARYTNFHDLALFALGTYRSKLPAGGEARYIALARKFLGRYMAENSTRISGSGITIQTCTAEVVNARFGNGTTVQFRLAGPRRVADISVSGVSLAGILRSKFTDFLRSHNGDFSAFMTYLEQ